MSDLRIPFAIQEEELADDPALGKTALWTDVGTAWGSLEEARSQDVSHRAFFRASLDVRIATGMRLVRGGRAFLVLRVAKVEERERWTMVELREIMELDQGN